MKNWKTILMCIVIGVAIVLLLHSCAVKEQEAKQKAYDMAYQEGYDKGYTEGQENVFNYPKDYNSKGIFSDGDMKQSYDDGYDEGYANAWKKANDSDEDSTPKSVREMTFEEWVAQKEKNSTPKVTCDKCGNEIPDGAIYCPWCGKKQLK